jgi:hypothetical protein
MDEIKSKDDAYDKLHELLDGSDVDTIISYLADYYSTQELIEFIEHIKSEQGL